MTADGADITADAADATAEAVNVMSEAGDVTSEAVEVWADSVGVTVETGDAGAEPALVNGSWGAQQSAGFRRMMRLGKRRAAKAF